MDPKAKRKLDLFGLRDFTVALLEYGLDAESGPLPYFEDKELVKPYFVTERKNGKSGLFIDAAQVEWQKEEHLRRTEKDESYLTELLKEVKEKYGKIKDDLEKGQPLTLEQFEKFLPLAKDAWRWYAGIWWAVEVFEQKNKFPHLLDLCMKFRKETDKFIPASDHVVRVTINSLYPSLGQYCEVVLINEVLTGEFPDEKVLQDRYEHSLLVGHTIYTGDSIEEIKDSLGIELAIPKAEDHQENREEIKGQVAYKGKYTGKVSIVITKEQASAFEEGRVLVSSSTTPDLIMAIRKAGAIVADEGGIISHAAISSREFKIPCIIGTKIATHVLKDGDMVEVDAEKGIVRIIK